MSSSPRPPLVLVTGFGPFLDVATNPSGLVAGALAERPPEGLDVVSAVLPVTFRGAGEALEAALEGALPRVPDLLLALGVHRRPWLRLERRAGPRLASPKPDTAGGYGHELGELPGGELACRVDLERAAELLRAAGGEDVRVSDDAGGYVCERTFHAALSAGARLSRPALFLHVPPVERLDAARQEALVRAWLPGLVALSLATP